MYDKDINNNNIHLIRNNNHQEKKRWNVDIFLSFNGPLQIQKLYLYFEEDHQIIKIYLHFIFLFVEIFIPYMYDIRPTERINIAYLPHKMWIKSSANGKDKMDISNLPKPLANVMEAG